MPYKKHILFKNSLLIKLSFIIIFCISNFAQSESVNVPKDWQTLAESTNYQQTWRYNETIEFAKKLDKASDLITYTNFGKSGEGREIPLLIVAKNKAFTPELARKQSKAIVFIQAGIHAGEIDGKDAGFALIRDIAITKTRLDLLDNVVIIFCPIYNVDGHENWSAFNRINQNGPSEMGFRANSRNQNLNRDYMKADEPETRSFLRLWNTWQPDFFFDLHVTNGADYRYNVTYEYAHHNEMNPMLKDWMKDNFDKKVVPNMEKEGNVVTNYLEFAGREVANGIRTFIPTPRFATGYTPLRNRIGLLVETHSLKPYKSRVRGTYDLLRYTIEEIGRDKNSLLKTNQNADLVAKFEQKEYIINESNKKFPLSQTLTDKSVDFAFKGVEYSWQDSEISGGKKVVYGTKPLDITIKKYDEAKIVESVTVPIAYIIPPQWKDVIERLELHDIKYERLKANKEFEVESYKLTEPKFATNSFEGRITLQTKPVVITEKRLFIKDSVIVRLNQTSAQIAIHLLEPNAPDSLVYWGFFNSIFEQKEYFSDYIMEKIASEMLVKDENLRTEFTEKLKDEKFAKSPRARLNFFYERSPYARERLGIYPVGRVMKNFVN